MRSVFSNKLLAVKRKLKIARRAEQLIVFRGYWEGGWGSEFANKCSPTTAENVQVALDILRILTWFLGILIRTGFILVSCFSSY